MLTKILCYFIKMPLNVLEKLLFLLLICHVLYLCMNFLRNVVIFLNLRMIFKTIRMLYVYAVFVYTFIMLALWGKENLFVFYPNAHCNFLLRLASEYSVSICLITYHVIPNSLKNKTLFIYRFNDSGFVLQMEVKERWVMAECLTLPAPAWGTLSVVQ